MYLTERAYKELLEILEDIETQPQYKGQLNVEDNEVREIYINNIASGREVVIRKLLGYDRTVDFDLAHQNTGGELL